jgi:hypothetical protein
MDTSSPLENDTQEGAFDDHDNNTSFFFTEMSEKNNNEMKRYIKYTENPTQIDHNYGVMCVIVSYSSITVV